MEKNNIKGTLILLLTALIWGFAFVAQTAATDSMPPFAFNAVRSLIGTLVILLLNLIKKKRTAGYLIFPTTRRERKDAITAAIFCGICLSIAVNLQQVGLGTYPHGIAASARGGFITTIYVVIVPFFSLFSKKAPHPLVWVAVAVAMFGTYLLCLSDGISGMYLGDILMMLCALSYSFQILTVDMVGWRVGGLRLSLYQFIICTVISALLSLIFEKNGFALSNIAGAFWPIMYVGVLSSGVAYTLQIAGQRYADATVASIVMSFESVFAAIGGAIAGEGPLSSREIAGCALVFAAILTAQLPDFIRAKRERKTG